MGWLQRIDAFVKTTNSWASWAWRLAPILTSGAMSAWIATILNAPGWAIYLGTIGALNFVAMLFFWVGIARIHAENAGFQSAEVQADNERKRQRIAKWRSMMATVSKDAQTYPVPTKIPIGMILRGYPDFLSLEPHLKKSGNEITSSDTCHASALGPIYLAIVSDQISKLENEWEVG